MIEDVIQEAFSSDNLEIIWENRVSKKELIPLNSSYPIRNVLNDKGTRNIELMLNSNKGFFGKTLALIEDSDLLFPKEIKPLVRSIDLGGFKKYDFKKEIDLLIGAFSLETLFSSLKKEDVPYYTANGLAFELVVAYDGNIQCFEKSDESDLSMIDPMAMLDSSEFDGKPLSSYKVSMQGLQVFPTNYTHKWVDRLKTQRLLQAFNVIE